MLSKQLQIHWQLLPEGRKLLKNAMERLSLSAHTYDQILKVVRTTSDLSFSKKIEIDHIGEAINHRSLDRENWET